MKWTMNTRIVYKIISKAINKKAKRDIGKYNLKIIQEKILESQSQKKVKSKQKLGQDRLVTLLHMHGRVTLDQDKFIERIQELYTEIYVSEQTTITHTHPKEVPDITPWEATLRDMVNMKRTYNDHIYTHQYIESRRR